jgi:hypothetical protein
MHIHHVVRGGLLAIGMGMFVMSVTASADTGSPGVSAAPAVGRAVVTGDAADEVGLVVAPSPSSTAPPIPLEVATIVPGEQVKTDGAEPVRPVIQAGPGPATPVEGATTLIDPLVIVR